MSLTKSQQYMKSREIDIFLILDLKLKEETREVRSVEKFRTRSGAPIGVGGSAQLHQALSIRPVGGNLFCLCVVGGKSTTNVTGTPAGEKSNNPNDERSPAETAIRGETRTRSFPQRIDLDRNEAVSKRKRKNP
ncbi:hypothetical protein AAG570_010081 [Ranatra chinensis]|uniref:Uncharacterized protein n=1 Tax=Ranatra chinensis TaxID=642074 RepID=A0ABD0YLH8_9HEMI